MHFCIAEPRMHGSLTLHVDEACMDISGNRALCALTSSDLSVIRTQLTSVPLERGRTLFSPGAAIDYVYFPVSGMISLLSHTHGGDAIETGVVGCEGIAGATVAFGNPETISEAMVQIEGHAFRISSADFLRAFKSSEKLRSICGAYQSFLLTQAQQAAACHALHSVNSRLARWLLQSADVMRSNDFKLTQEYLSHMLGVHRSTVSLEANTLQQAGLIHYSRGNVNIKDRASLEDCACECYRIIRRQFEALKE